MNDFADWFSPILVKELRQGMRTRAFIGIFIVSQLAMILGVILSLENSSNHNTVDGIFWTLVGITTLFAMPMRGLPALNGEIKGNTLELMLLTQLSAWRITAGKWLALVLQTSLVLCAVLPYVVLRYFLGGVDLVEELIMLGWMMASSALLTALAVGLSPFMQSVVGRLVLGFGVFGSLQVLPALLYKSTMGAAPLQSTWLWAAVLLGPLLVLEFFELGVGKIAPAAENHGTRKRLIVLAILAIGVILGSVLHQLGFMLTLAAIAITPICLGTFVEDTVAVPSLYRPFVRWKLPGYLAGRILYPGWATGLVFVLLIGAVFLASAPIQWKDPDEPYQVLLAFEAVLAPLALIRLVFRRAKSILPYYFGLQLLLFILALIITAGMSGSQHRSSGLFSLGALVPTTGFFLNMWKGDLIESSLPLSLATTGAALLVLAGLSIKEWKLIGAMEREAAKLD